MSRPGTILVIIAALAGGVLGWTEGGTIFRGLSFVAFGVALVGCYYLLFGRPMAAVLVRAVFAMVPVGLLTGGVIFGILQTGNLDPRVTQALIAAVVVVAGWIVTYLTGQWRSASAEQERRRDIIRAAITELELIADHGKRADWDKAKADAHANFRKNARYDIFIFYGHQYHTLRRLVDQIEVLDWGQIRPVMDIFQALDRLQQMEQRMQSDAFAALPKSRREDGLQRYLTIQAQVSVLADKAVAALRDAPFQGWLRNLR